jgi:UDP-N-acetylglucosamine 4,6-dehydratase
VQKIKANQPLTITDPQMTRFLMSLNESVDLVLYTFRHGKQGDIFVQKAPATTIANLAESLKTIFKSDVRFKIIGTRHGEKLYETLVSREEMAKAKDLGRYYRIPADNRTLNYDIFISEGQPAANEKDDYSSHTTDRLGKAQTVRLLKSIEYIKQELSTKTNDNYENVD